MIWWMLACSGSLQERVEALQTPDGVEATLFAEVPGARSLALADDGTVVVGTRDRGVVWALRDHDADGVADEVRALADGLDVPNGVAVVGDDVYVAEHRRIVVLRGALGAELSRPEPEMVLSGLPDDDHHGWRYLAVGPDGALYVTIGAPCNSCEVAHPYAAIHRVGDGELQPVATGVRNSMGLAWAPTTGELWFTDNGRDGMGDDVPADELNRLGEEGDDFGFPRCHATDVIDPALGAEGDCATVARPEVELVAHGASLGLTFAVVGAMPAPFTDALFVAQHGSWDRSEPSGYRVVAVDREQGTVTPFVEGWLRDDGSAWGRPVDLVEAHDGALLLSDDEAGAIVRLAPTP
jgi:glucose/arabinose dehydrogenase